MTDDRERRMQYREATRDDAWEIAVLHAESWRVTYRGAYRDKFLDSHVVQDRIIVWEQRLSAPSRNQFVVIAEEENHIVGFACVYGAHDEHWGSLLDNMHVRRDHHRQGAGARLLKEVATWCIANYPECGLHLWVLEQNRQAQLFYERLGATDRGGQVSEPPGGGQVKSRRYAWTNLADIEGVSGSKVG